jgi:hypothetical protein
MTLLLFEEKQKIFVYSSYTILHYKLIPPFISVSFNFQVKQATVPSLYVNISIQIHTLEKLINIL